MPRMADEIGMLKLLSDLKLLPKWHPGTAQNAQDKSQSRPKGRRP